MRRKEKEGAIITMVNYANRLQLSDEAAEARLPRLNQCSDSGLLHDPGLSCEHLHRLFCLCSCRELCRVQNATAKHATSAFQAARGNPDLTTNTVSSSSLGKQLKVTLVFSLPLIFQVRC